MLFEMGMNPTFCKFGVNGIDRFADTVEIFIS